MLQGKLKNQGMREIPIRELAWFFPDTLLPSPFAVAILACKQFCHSSTRCDTRSSSIDYLPHVL